MQLMGYLACALVFATFCMRAMLPLRLIAIGSNVAFVAYGHLGGLAPILLLHLVLLPLNIWRLCQALGMLSKAACGTRNVGLSARLIRRRRVQRRRAARPAADAGTDSRRSI
jgi:hypothetical protein